MTAKPTKTAAPIPTRKPVAATPATRPKGASSAKSTARMAVSPAKPSQSAAPSKQASPSASAPAMMQAPKRKPAMPVQSDELTTKAKVGLCALVLVLLAGGMTAAYMARPAPLSSQYSEAKAAERQARHQKQMLQAAAQRLRAWDNMR